MGEKGKVSRKSVQQRTHSKGERREKEPGERREQENAGQTKEQELLAQLQRLQAEFDNYQRRVADEREATRQRLMKEVLLDLLPIMDNFELALQHTTEAESFRRGVELIYAQCESFLEQHGVKSMPVEGTFDPARHEALLTEDVSGKKKGEILEVLQKGYLIGDAVLRSAKVKVAK